MAILQKFSDLDLQGWMVPLDNVQHSLCVLTCQLHDGGVRSYHTRTRILRVHELPEKFAQIFGRGDIIEGFGDDDTQTIKAVDPCIMAVHTKDKHSNSSSFEACYKRTLRSGR